MKISGHTRLFAVLGHPISHTKSPAFQNPGLQALGLDAVYLALDVHPDRLIPTLRSMADMGFAGCNLTIPHKEIAFQGVDRLSQEARRAASVNTIVFHPDGTLEGHSTDGYGLATAVTEAFGQGFEGRALLLLGCGGAGRAAAREAAERGAAALWLANRNPARAADLAAELRSQFPRLNVHACAAWPPAADEVRAADLILNATAIGMKPGDASPLPASAFTPDQSVLDMVYVDPVTPLMRTAQDAGARAVNGLGMLLHQGCRSLEIWTGQPAPVEIMRNALWQAVYGEAAHV